MRRAVINELSRRGEMRITYDVARELFLTFDALWTFCQRAQIRIASEINPNGERCTLIYWLKLY